MRQDHLETLKKQFGNEKILQCLDILTAYSHLIAPSLMRLSNLEELIRSQPQILDNARLELVDEPRPESV